MGHLHNALHHATALLNGLRVSIGAVADADFDGTSRFGETLQPVMDVWSRPEWRLPRGEITYARRISAPAVAARFSGLELINPVGSGVIVNVLTITGESYPQQIDLQIDSGGALGVTATLRGIALDSRHPQLGEASRCTLVSGDFAAGANLPLWRTASATPAVPFPALPLVLTPGFKLFIFGTVVNTALPASLVWTERLAMEGELTARG